MFRLETVWSYKWEIILLLFYIGILFFCSPLDITQLNLGDKSSLLLYQSVSLDFASKYSLYSLLGWVVTRLPMLDGMALSIFLSLLPAILSCILVYLIVLKETNSRLLSIIGGLILMSSSVYFLQAQKVEPYCLAGFLLILGYWLRDRKWLSPIIFGLSMLVHIFAFTMIFMLCTVKENVNMRQKSWLIFGILIVVWSAVILSQKDMSISLISDAISSRGNWSLMMERLSIIFISLLSILSFGFITSFILLFKRKDNYFYFSVVVFFILFSHSLTSYPGVNIVSIFLPLFAISSGIGAQYININLRKMLLVGCSLMILYNVFNFNLRSIDSLEGETSARSMINQLSMIKEESQVFYYKIYRGNIFADGFFQDGVTKYCNYKYDKHLSLLLVNSEDFDFEEEPEKDYYYFDLVNLDNFYSILKKKEANK